MRLDGCTCPVCAGPMHTRSKAAWQCEKRSSKRPVEGSLTSCSFSRESSHSVSAFSHRLFDSKVLAVCRPLHAILPLAIGFSVCYCFWCLLLFLLFASKVLAVCRPLHDTFNLVVLCPRYMAYPNGCQYQSFIPAEAKA